MIPSPTSSWRRQVLLALVLLLLIAGAVRLIYWMVAPLVPAIVVAVFLLVIYSLVWGRGHR